jgi:mono/diheme cytochrome c family protein
MKFFGIDVVCATAVMAAALAAACAIAAEPPSSSAPITAAASADSRPPGERLYARHCLSCHQADGGGVPNLQPPIAGGSWVKGDARALALFVMSGAFGSAERKDGAVDNVMPEFRQLSDEDLAGILSYIRAKFGGGASAVTAAEVAAARADLK